MAKYMKTNVAGVTYGNRQSVLDALSKQKGVYFQLVREPDNKYDKNAVKVLAVNRDRQEFEVGYLPKDKNEAIAKALNAKKMAFVKRYGHTGSVGRNMNRGLVLEIIYDELA